ncbi:DUF551 domain-containing protein [Yersinia enterocolitica]|uniref:DUF551 domain-containing protein n=1 Tax=Yersinia enterocolitica TaxID=630 RepID=UPI003F425577
MKELNSFTVEQLNDFIKSDHAQCGDVAALARIALAAKMAEPVSLKSAIVKFKEYNIGFPVEKLKADFVISWCLNNLTPQLNSPEIPDSWKLVPIEPTQNMVDAHISGMQLAGFSRAYRDMLAAAPEPQNQQQNIPENIPQGWIKCSDQMPEDCQTVLCNNMLTELSGIPFIADYVGMFDLHDGTRYEAGFYVNRTPQTVTHWMPLPAAPEKPL